MTLRPQIAPNRSGLFLYYLKERWRFELENRVTKLEGEMSDVKTRLAVAEAGLKDVKEDISSIKDDTKWLRRAITNAIIGSVVAGAIAVLFAAFKGGV